MIKNTKSVKITATILITLFLFLFAACNSHEKPSLPQWVKPFIESSHSVLAHDEDISNQDFSGILADKRVDFIGYIGDDYHKMNISFHTIKKESNTTYLISGSSKVRSNTCTFSGSAQILDIRELNEHEYGADDFMKGEIKKQGICIARYSLEEDKKQNGSGIFSGILLFHWYIDNNNRLQYDDVNDDSDGYSNNQFAGVWRSHSTGKEKKCAWGQFRIPDSGDLDIGAAEFSVNPIYTNNGWNTENPTVSWYGYYSVEIDLPNTDSESESGSVTYAIDFKPNECTYYKLQLHVNDTYTCEVADCTEDYISFRAVGEFTPNTEGKPLATLHKKNGNFYLSGPFIFDSNYNTNTLIQVEKKDSNESEESGITEYSYVQPDVIKDSIPQYSSYKILSKDSDTYFCISINSKEYQLSDILDYGDFDLKVYKNDNSTILLIGLIDFYASTHFVYLFKDNSLTRLGQIDVNQPSDVEEHGMRKVSFKIQNKNNKVIIESYLDDTYENKNEFPIK